MQYRTAVLYSSTAVLYHVATYHGRIAWLYHSTTLDHSTAALKCNTVLRICTKPWSHDRQSGNLLMCVTALSRSSSPAYSSLTCVLLRFLASVRPSGVNGLLEHQCSTQFIACTLNPQVHPNVPDSCTILRRHLLLRSLATRIANELRASPQPCCNCVARTPTGLCTTM